MPPSQVCRFEPRSGALLEPLMVVPGMVGPPLSLKNTIRVFDSRRSARNAAMILPTPSSMADSIAA